MADYLNLCAREHQLGGLIMNLLVSRGTLSGRGLLRNVLMVNAMRCELYMVSVLLYELAMSDIPRKE